VGKIPRNRRLSANEGIQWEGEHHENTLSQALPSFLGNGPFDSIENLARVIVIVQ